ncbi:MAG: exopolysaccharide biosynthesis protein [Rhizobiaceae bacterium]
MLPTLHDQQMPPPRRLSVIFSQLSARDGGTISIGEIRDALGDRSFAALLLLFAALNLLPLPIGTTLIFGPPMVLVALQMVLGYDTPWLPKWLTGKTVSVERFRKAAKRLIPLLERLERYVRPRSWPFAPGAADRPIGMIALVMAIAVTLPIPLGNWLPSLSVAVIGLALGERDGVCLAAGCGIGIVSLAIIGAVVGAGAVLAGMFFG